MSIIWTRRRFLGNSAAAAATLVQPFRARGAYAAEPDAVIELRAESGSAPLWKGAPTRNTSLRSCCRTGAWTATTSSCFKLR